MDHHEDDAPPPYSEIDPLQQSIIANSGSDEIPPGTTDAHLQGQIQLPLRLRGGDAPLPTSTPTPTASTSADDARSEADPVPLASAAAYFAERPLPSVSPAERDTLIHHMTIYARSQGKDFPRRPRCWNSRADEITQHDWDTFLTFLFPPHLAPAASSNRLPRRLRAEIERDRKDRPQETDEEREARIAAVLTEWNEGFFGPRATWVSWVYVADLERGPPSPLCPECYPAATQASQNRNRPARSRSVEAPMPVQTEPSRRSVGPQADDGLIPVESEAAASPSRPWRPFAPWDVYPGTPAPPLSSNDSAFRQDSSATYFHGSSSSSFHRESTSWESGPIAWAAQISARAQQYAEKISEQALQYGKWIEENAMMRGRQIEEAGDRLSNWASSISHRQVWSGWPPNGNHASNPRYNRPRRASTSSTSSVESLSSIDSLSTVSDLDPADLATVRAQLLSLDTYHGRELHAAAVGLRSQLRVLQQSRREARFRACRGGFGARRGHWGRWESPEEGRQREHQRRAMREETRALRDTFRMVERRAREETREQQRARRERRSRQGHGREEGHVRPGQVSARSIESDADKEVYVLDSQSTTDSSGTFNRRASDLGPNPAPDPAPGQNLRPSATSPCSSSSPSLPSLLNPREAAKAWADAQRAKAKAIQKLAKEQRKAVEKSQKELEKEIRKAAKHYSKQLRRGTSLTRAVFSESGSESSTAATKTAASASASTKGSGSSIPPQESGIITRGAEKEAEREE
ncbi:hypothetical protein VTN77DRAFT_7091 [Rasamsonia byssochlamydoides]|uniref:uncharacterized protein n=1 Tax=Rasamsonia byssochlamydoides TaxID=89139 RepID=UPI003743AE63